MFKKRSSIAVAAIVVATPCLGALHATLGHAGRGAEPPRPGAGFEAFAPDVAVRREGDWVRVESNGLPDHPMMTGIRTWQQQVPLPQKYIANNAWSIPATPIPAANPMSAKDHFLRGAIALAANGVPIFNALNNRGVDSFRAGELDEFGGHSGRADDYHYHVAPLHLQAKVGPRNPIGWALDGYPLYGEKEPDGAAPGKLDAFNGHTTAELGYHYHGTKTYPYLNGGFHGEVREVDGQVDPQPRATGVRPDTPPLPGARIIGFERKGKTEFSLRYEVNGKPARIDYRIQANGSVVFDYQYSNGTSETRTYQPRRQGGGGGQRGPGDGGRGPGGQGNGASSGADGQTENRKGPDPVQETRGSGGPDRRRSPDPVIATAKPDGFQVQLPGVANGGAFPIDATCDGMGVAPELVWKNAPVGTKAFALAMHHQPPGDESPHVYWVVTAIPASTTGLKANDPSVGRLGANTIRRQPGYAPPCSQGPGKKWYTLTLYALSSELELPAGATTRDQLLKGVDGKTLGTAVMHLSHTRTSGNN